LECCSHGLQANLLLPEQSWIEARTSCLQANLNYQTSTAVPGTVMSGLSCLTRCSHFSQLLKEVSLVQSYTTTTSEGCSHCKQGIRCYNHYYRYCNGLVLFRYIHEYCPWWSWINISLFGMLLPRIIALGFVRRVYFPSKHGLMSLIFDICKHVSHSKIYIYNMKCFKTVVICCFCFGQPEIANQIVELWLQAS